MTVIDICRFENGKLVEHWGVPDRFAMLHQAGALPPRWRALECPHVTAKEELLALADYVARIQTLVE
jgi:hypothetical protein